MFLEVESEKSIVEYWILKSTFVCLFLVVYSSNSVKSEKWIYQSSIFNFLVGLQAYFS